MSETNLISVKELAQQLDQSDALLKKFIRDFGIDCERIKKRIHLPDESVDVLKEILRLRASGKKNKEIKEMFDLAQAAGKANISDAPLAKEEPVAKEEGKAEEKTETEAKAAKTKRGRPKKATKKKEEEPEAKEETDAQDESPVEAEEKQVSTKEETPKKTSKKSKQKKTAKSKPEEKEQKKKEEAQEDDYSEYLHENVEESHEVQDEIALALQEIPEDEVDLDDESILEDVEEEDPKQIMEELRGKPMGPRKMRRRAFNFRFVQRQIANDSRRIDYLRHKLNKSSLSTMDRLKYQDAIDRRSKLLSGWLHLLRWVKSR